MRQCTLCDKVFTLKPGDSVKCSCGAKAVRIQKFEAGDIVQLNKAAIEDYYSQPDTFTDYIVGAKPENMTSQEFLNFVECTLAFNNGEGYGMVDRVDSRYIKVKYIKPYSEEIDYAFYCHRNLNKVKSNE